MHVFEYENVSVNVFAISQDGVKQQQLSLPVYSLDRFSSLQWKLSRKLGVGMNQTYVQVECNDQQFYPFTYTIDPSYVSEADQAILQAQSPSDFVDNTHQSKQTKNVQIGPISIPRVFVEAHRRRPFEDWNNVTYISTNYQVLGSMAPLKENKLLIQVLVMEQEVNLDIIPKYLQRSELRMPIICGFILRYFPYIFIPNVAANQQDSFAVEQSLMAQFIQKQSSDQKESPDSDEHFTSRYYIKELKVVHDCAQHVDLQVMFNSIKLMGFGLSYMQFYHNRGNQQYIATKIPIASPSQDIIQYTFTEPRLRMMGPDWCLTVESDGRLIYQAFLKQSEQEFITNDSLSEVLERLEYIVMQLNQIEEQFSSKPLFLNPRYLKFYIAVDQYIQHPSILPINISTSLKEFMTHHTDIIAFEEAYKNYKTSLFADELYNFKIQIFNEYVIYEYTGIYTEHLWTFPLLLAELVTTRHVEQQSSHYSERGVHQKQDPVLFNNLTTTYSRACQSQKKPVPVSKDGPLTYKYWNFTTEREQYYRCNDKFPYLYFMSGLHKQNYCVPCCTNKPLGSKNKINLFKRCQEQHVIMKDKAVTSYVLQNTQQFQQGRYTVLDHLIQKHLVSNKAFVFTVTMPEYYQSKRQSVASLIKAVAFALKLKEEQILQHIAQEHVSQLRNITNDVDIDLWVEYISHVVSRVFQAQIVIVDAQTFDFYSTVFNEMAIFLLYVKNTYNPIRFDKMYKVPSYQFKLMSQMEEYVKSQQTHHPQNVKSIMEEIGVKNIHQLATLQGFARYLIGEIEDYYMILPTFPAFTDQIPETRRLPDTSKINTNAQLIKDILMKFNKNIQYQVYDEQNTLTGYIADDLFYPCISPDVSSQGETQLPIYQVRVNPFKLNHALLEYQEQTSRMASIRSRSTATNNKPAADQQKNNAQISAKHYDIYMSAYVSYLYELLSMQNPVSEEDIEYMEIPAIVEHVKNQSGNPEHIRKISSCKRAPGQFFCSKQKLIIPIHMKPLVRTFVNDRKLQKNFKALISYMIADTEFQNDASEILKIELKTP